MTRPTSPIAERAATPGPAAGRQAGFTLVETLVVLTLMALVVGLAAPKIARMTGFGVEAAAEEVAAALRDARGRAIRLNRPVAATIDADAGRVWVEGGGPRVEIPGGVETGLLLAASERTGPAAGRIVFFPEGGATGGRVTLRRGARAVDVGVDWFDGAVQVEAVDAPS